MTSVRNEALAKVRRAVARRRRALTLGLTKRADSALAVARRWREVAQRHRPYPGRRCRRPKLTLTSAKRWDQRAAITPRLLVLHSTESAPGTGLGVSHYLARADIQADVHVTIDSNGDLYRLVPDGRKAWHVAGFNSVALGIEQVGRASQSTWPEVQLRAVAKQLACWSRKYDIPLVDARENRAGRGVTTHSALGYEGGNHHDPGEAYPFDRVLKLARKYR